MGWLANSLLLAAASALGRADAQPIGRASCLRAVVIRGVELAGCSAHARIVTVTLERAIALPAAAEARPGRRTATALAWFANDDPGQLDRRPSVRLADVSAGAAGSLPAAFTPVEYCTAAARS